MPTTGKPSPFKIVGGRAGTIAYEARDLVGELGWETLAGDVEMVIYASECRWTAREVRPMKPDEIVDVVRRLAAALPGRIEIAFTDTSQVIEPV